MATDPDPRPIGTLSHPRANRSGPLDLNRMSVAIGTDVATLFKHIPCGLQRWTSRNARSLWFPLSALAGREHGGSCEHGQPDNERKGKKRHLGTDALQRNAKCDHGERQSEITGHEEARQCARPFIVRGRRNGHREGASENCARTGADDGTTDQVLRITEIPH